MKNLGTILAVDDSLLCRTMVAATLGNNGYTVLTAALARDGFALLADHPVQLIILDWEMPDINGPAFLGQLRSQPQWAELPVIMLIDRSEQQNMRAAIRLGANEYVLKSTFSVPALLASVRKLLPPPAENESKDDESIPQNTHATQVDHRLDRNTVLRSIGKVNQLKALTGSIAKIVAIANSPRADADDLVQVIRREPILAARVFHLANCALSNPQATTLDESVRLIGTGGVRDLAQSLRFIESQSLKESDLFQYLACWQHTLAIALLTEFMLDGCDIEPGTPYLAGLLHDFGDIFARQLFPKTCRALADASAARKIPQNRLFPDYFGLNYGELTSELLKHSRLPQNVTRPITQAAAGSNESLIARAIKVAHFHSHRMFDSSTPQTNPSPPNEQDYQGLPRLPSPEVCERIRAETISACCALGLIDPSLEAKLMEPMKLAAA